MVLSNRRSSQQTEGGFCMRHRISWRTLSACVGGLAVLALGMLHTPMLSLAQTQVQTSIVGATCVPTTCSGCIQKRYSSTSHNCGSYVCDPGGQFTTCVKATDNCSANGFQSHECTGCTRRFCGTVQNGNECPACNCTDGAGTALSSMGSLVTCI